MSGVLFSPPCLFNELRMSKTIRKRDQISFIRWCVEDHGDNEAGLDKGASSDGGKR